jgi:hypothetical protein
MPWAYLNKMEHFPHNCDSSRQRTVDVDTRMPNRHGGKIDTNHPVGGRYLIILLRIPVMKVYISGWSLPRSDVVCLGGEARRFGTNGCPHYLGSQRHILTDVSVTDLCVQHLGYFNQ